MNKNNRGDSTADVIFFLFIIVVFCAIVGMASHEMGKKKIRVEAVKNGHGEWVVNTEGSPSFAWKNEKQLEKTEAKKEKTP
jgi:hypothetical protein